MFLCILSSRPLSLMKQIKLHLSKLDFSFVNLRLNLNSTMDLNRFYV